MSEDPHGQGRPNSMSKVADKAAQGGSGSEEQGDRPVITEDESPGQPQTSGWLEPRGRVNPQAQPQPQSDQEPGERTGAAMRAQSTVVERKLRERETADLRSHMLGVGVISAWRIGRCRAPPEPG
ncbi:hypothetical protein AXG93_2675s1190 [Marchantia polymorpha subsp. ruderalis]|uniref:Uncharacterized protein n=1 Tax=Marchantia polymorpha subsp. ruderalis TaxID=1480154 RepID=A0A176VS53_MARPO|nr:hypothetical protein AXG93_2675s1190 [Marchantia polymorpha subsp. ruderalis]